MKIYLLWFFILFFCYSSDSQQKNSLTEDGLKGNVKSLRHVSFYAIDKFGEIIKGSKGSAGFLAPDDFQKKYNNNGFQTESILRYFGEGDSLIFQEFYKYDGKGNETEIYQTASNGESGKETYKYDDKSNPIEFNRYFLDSLEGSWKYNYKYDDKNNIIEENTYTDGSLEGQLVTYEYDDKDNMVEVKVYTDGKLLHWKHRFKYDDKGNAIEKSDYTYEGLTWQEIYKYDDRNNLIEKSIFKINRIYKYKYDDKDNLIEETYWSDDGSSSQEIYKYDYDGNNNWIKRIHFIDDRPQYITEREIEYY